MVGADVGTANADMIEEFIGGKQDTTSLFCYGCGDGLIREFIGNLNYPARGDDDDDSLATKRLQQAQQEGLQIDYRCPRCRQCTDCRNSFETERVSLREEAEDLMIRDSVTID